MKQPVLFLAFANVNDNHLPLLDQERKDITQHLLPLESQQFIQLITESSATINDIATYLAGVKDRLVVFHYAGHAEHQHLILSDQAADGAGLADMLALQKNLKLVFLNGCSTRDQVAQLLEKGVKAVIATSVPIGDKAAQAFSATFYQALATQHTLKEAFDMSAAKHKMASGENLENHRGLQLPGAAGNPLPWGLYTLDDADPILDWKLPLQAANSFILPNAGLKYKADQVMNKHMVETIANAISGYSLKIRFMFEEAKMRKRDPKLRELRAAVIDSFPTPIGMHLRRLIQSDKINPERLQRIVNVYSVSVELLAYIMLAQLWDEKHKNKTLNIPESQSETIRHLLTADETNRSEVNYLDVIRAVSDIFDVNEIEPYVVELQELREDLFEEGKFLTAHLALEEMKDKLETTIAADEIESFCVQAEEHLCVIFSYLGFAAKYTMAAIKTIELHKERHEHPNFRHNLVILNRLMESIGVLDDVLISEAYSDNNVVVLLRSEEEVTPSLNLSPFIIDENALSGQYNSKLFFYRFQTTDGKMVYELVENRRDQLKIDEEMYPQVKMQLQAYKRQIIGD